MSLSKDSVISGTFSRTALRNRFGNSFPSLGFTKRGFLSNEINPRLSPAVIDKRVRLREDGKINKTCAAYRQGLVELDADGELDLGSSLVLSGELNVRTTNSSHIQSFEVTDAVFRSCELSVSRDEAAAIVLAMNRDDNLQIKSRRGNMSGTYHMEGRGDLALDNEIIAAVLAGGEQCQLSAAAVDRARRVMAIVSASKHLMPDRVIEAFISRFSRIVDENGHKVCRSNMAVTAVCEGESRRSYCTESSRTETGRNTDGTPDLRTTKGRQLRDRKETGLKADGTPDLRTTKGLQLQEELNVVRELVASERTGSCATPATATPATTTAASRRAETGLKADGTPDLRTTKGLQLQEELNVVRELVASERTGSCATPATATPAATTAASHRAETGLKADGTRPSGRLEHAHSGLSDGYSTPERPSRGHRWQEESPSSVAAPFTPHDRRHIFRHTLATAPVMPACNATEASRRAETGRKADGTPDLRTTKGLQLHKELNAVFVHSTSSRSTRPVRHIFSSSPPRHTLATATTMPAYHCMPPAAPTHSRVMPSHSMSGSSGGSSSGGERFYKGGQFIPGGGESAQGRRVLLA